MARIEWVKQRLVNWSLWKESAGSGGLGFATQSSFLNVASSGGFREAVVPVDEVDASLTNDAVNSLKPTRPHLWETLQCIYPLGLTIKETARRCELAESTIKAHLDSADAALAQWFRDRNEAMENKKKTFTT